MKSIRAVVFAVLALCGFVAYATVDPLGPTQQTFHATDLASLVAKPGLHPGMTATVDNNGVNQNVRYTVIPAGSKTVAWPDVQNCTASTCQVASDAAMILPGTITPKPHASSHITGGSDVIPTVSYTTSGVVPPTTTNNQVFGVKPIVGFGFFKIDNAQIDSSAAIGVTKLALGGVGTVLSSDGSTNAFRTYATLGLNTGSGTQNYLPKYTATGTTLGNSAVVDDGTYAYVLRNATGTADSPLDWSQFAIRGATDPTLRLALAFDTTRNVGTIQAGKSGFGELPIIVNPKGSAVGFGVADPTAGVDTASLRVRGPQTPIAGRALVFNDASGAVTVGGTTPDWYATSPAGAVNPLYINTGAGLEAVYDSFTSSLSLQTNFPITDWYTPTGNVYVEHVTQGRGIQLEYDEVSGYMSIGTNFEVPSNPTTTKSGTHRVHRYHDERAFEPGTSGSPTVIDYPEATWKGDTVDPNASTWYTMATVTVRAQWMDAVSNVPLERTQKTLIYKQRVGGTWDNGGTTVVQTIGTQSDGFSVAVSLTGTGNRTVRVSVWNAPTPSNLRDCVIFVDIDGGGNYAS